MSKTGTETITLSAQDLARLTEDQFTALLLAAIEIRGTCVVRDREGRIKYDRPELAGQYHEEG